MSIKSPKFLLKVANAIVDEAFQIIKENIEFAYEGSSVISGLFGKKTSFTEAMDKSRARSRVEDAEKDLNLALNLVDTIIQADPNITLDDGITPMDVKGLVFYYRGYSTAGKGEISEAINYFKESIKYSAIQEAYFNMALCYLKTFKKVGGGLFASPKPSTEEAVEAFQKCIELDPETDIAIRAGKELLRIGQL